MTPQRPHNLLLAPDYLRETLHKHPTIHRITKVIVCCDTALCAVAADYLVRKDGSYVEEAWLSVFNETSEVAYGQGEPSELKRLLNDVRVENFPDQSVFSSEEYTP